VSRFLRVHIRIEPLSGPALPCDFIGRTDKVAGQTSTFVAKHRTADAFLVIHAPKFPPHEKPERIGGYENGLLSWSHVKKWLPAIGIAIAGVMIVEDRTTRVVSVLDVNPGLIQ
jgi:hypothetical protein